MDGCKGQPESKGYRKPCPLRDSCARYRLHLGNVKPSGYFELYGPYDFEDEECGKYIER